MPDASEINIDLESEFLPALAELLQRELDYEYPKPIKSKAQRLAKRTALTIQVSGDEIAGRCDDGRGCHQWRLTVPLYDLNEGHSFATCSCIDNLMPLDQPRCHHLYLAQSKLLDYLEAQSSPSAQHQDWQEAFADHQMMDPTAQLVSSIEVIPKRLVWEVGKDLLPLPRLQEQRLGKWSQGRILTWQEFISDADYWVDDTAQLCAARVKPEGSSCCVDTAGLWRDLIGSKLVFWQASGQPLQVCFGQLGLRLNPVSSGFQVQLSLGGDRGQYKTQLSDGSLVMLSQDRSTIYLSESHKSYARMIARFISGQEVIPSEDRLVLLSYLSQLEGEIRLDYRGILTEEVKKGQPQVVMRLAPFKEIGLTLHLLIKPDSQLRAFPAGEGPEQVLDMSDPERPVVVTRNLEVELEMVSSCIARFRLHRFRRHEEKPLFFIERADAIELAYEIEMALGDDNLCLEWPKDLIRPQFVKQELDENAVPQIRLVSGQDWFDLKVQLGEQEVELGQLLKALQEKRRFVELRGGLQVRLRKAFRKKIETVVGRLGLDQPAHASAAMHIPNLVRLQQEGLLQVNSTDDRWQRYQNSLRQDVAIHSSIQANLRDYQKQGVEFLLKAALWSPGALLADDMGLGKTLQSIVFLSERQALGPSLVICPTSVTPGWKAEIVRFAPHLRPMTWKEFLEAGLPAEAGIVVVCSYGLLRYQAPTLLSLEWNVLVIDEAQYIKNPKSQSWRTLARVKRSFCLALSGTPVENNLTELWSLFEMLAPSALGDLASFRQHFIEPIQGRSCQITRDRLGRMISPLMLRRLKKDCLNELPSKSEQTLWVKLSSEERKVYDSLRLEALDHFKQAEGVSYSKEKRFEILAALTRLRMCCSNVALVDPDWQNGSTKLLELMRLLESLQIGGHSVLVFSQFVSHLEMIGKACQRRGYHARFLTGNTKTKERRQLVDAFQAGAFDIFLISLKAGGTGLNLTRANYVIHADPWWNPAVEDQATDRAHRMGQKRSVTIYRLVAKETVEEKIIDVHKNKRNLADGLMASAESQGDWKLWESLLEDEGVSVCQDSKKG